MQQLAIRNIECHSFHGCLPEETIIGSRFSVDLIFNADFQEAVQNDELSKTIDYVLVHQIVREEMGISSKLIEHVAGRILKRMKQTFSIIDKCTVIVTKFNPPVNGQLESAVFTLEG